MGELNAILRALRTGNPDELALATVVHVEGSTYRLPGARMLIDPNRERIGSVSGGCLEADVVEHALHVIETGRSKYLLYNAKSPGGDLMFGLGCQGMVGILIERVSDPEVARSLRFLAACREQRRSGVIATVFQVRGGCRIDVGARVLLDVDCESQSDAVDAPLIDAVRAELRAAPDSARASTRSVSLPGGSVDLLLEPVLPPVSLLICGAGQDAIPLAQYASKLGWQVTVADHRAAFLSHARFPGADALIETPAERLGERVTLDSRGVAVVMSHNYEHDRAFLAFLIPSPARYIGLLGPRTRAERLLTDLQTEGSAIRPEHLARLYSPAGLDIGSETPDEIALAIVAEIQAVFSDRNAGFLRDRRGGIHLRSASAV